jgi:hypothetical protein
MAEYNVILRKNAFLRKNALATGKRKKVDYIR